MKETAYQKAVRLFGDAAKAQAPDYRVTVKDPACVNLLRAARADGSLTLVLGAGASVGAKIPDWKKLIGSLADEVFAERFKLNVADVDVWQSMPGETKVRLLESMTELKSAFRSALHRELYKGYSGATTSPIIASVGAYIARHIRRGQTLNVITYNFDDLLERHLAAKHGSITVRSIFSKDTFGQKGAQVRIYHPHGFLPYKRSTKFPADGFLVFSEPEYHTQYFDLTHWSNLIQLQCFLQTVCLFLGFSFQDKNVRRLMDQANKADGQNAGAIELRHVAVRQRKIRDDDTTSAELARLTNFLIEADYKSFGIRPYWVDDYDNDIPKLLAAH